MMQSNNTYSEPPKLAMATLAERNPAAAATIQKANELLAKVKDFTKSYLEEFSALLAQLVTDMENANECWAERLGIGKVDCASDPAIPEVPIPQLEMDWIQSQPVEFRPALLDYAREMPAPKSSWPLLELLGDLNVKHQELEEYLADHFSLYVTAKQFTDRCNNPEMLFELAEAAGMRSEEIEEARGLVKGMGASAACEYLRSEDYCFTGNIIGILTR